MDPSQRVVPTRGSRPVTRPEVFFLSSGTRDELYQFTDFDYKTLLLFNFMLFDNNSKTYSIKHIIETFLIVE